MVALEVRTAGLILVGDEVLSGSVVDNNSHFVCQRLHSLGVRLLKVVVLPDIVDAIADEVRDFSGFPANLRRAFVQLEGEIRSGSSVHFHSREIYLDVDEPTIVEPLNQTVDEFKNVAFGSYPNCGAWTFPTKLTLESTSWPTLHAATKSLLARLRPDWVLGLSPTPMESIRQFADAAADPVFKKALLDTLEVLSECCDRYTPEQIVLCFNGGKDATVLLHLACAVIRHRFPEHSGKPLLAFWVRSAEPFPEVRAFVTRMVQEYNLELEELPGPIKVGLEKYLADKPQIKAALIGVRRTDPSSSRLSAFQVTDEGWPPVMRVSPIVDWRYADVWTFLRELQLPYCSLYDRGYTSLGNPNNTRPNPTLLTVDEAGVERYKPAWQLEDESTERDGRC